MTEKKTRRKRKPRHFKQAPVWERGYRSWSFWEGNNKLGSVDLGAYGEWDGKYRWRVATRAGEAGTLALAKKAVEQFASYEKAQLSLPF